MLRWCRSILASSGSGSSSLKLNPVSARVRSLMSTKESLHTVSRATETFDLSQPLHPLLCVEALRKLADDAELTNDTSGNKIKHLAECANAANADGLWKRVVPQLVQLRAAEAVQPALLPLISLMLLRPEQEYGGPSALRGTIKEFMSMESATRISGEDAAILLRALLPQQGAKVREEEEEVGEDLISAVVARCKPHYTFVSKHTELLGHDVVRRVLRKLCHDTPINVEYRSLPRLVALLDAAAATRIPRPPRGGKIENDGGGGGEEGKKIPEPAIAVSIVVPEIGIEVTSMLRAVAKFLLPYNHQQQQQQQQLTTTEASSPCIALSFPSVALILQRSLEALQALEKPEEILFRKPIIHTLHDLTKGLLHLESSQPHLSNMWFLSKAERQANLQTLRKLQYMCRGLVHNVFQLRNSVAFSGNSSSSNVAGGKTADDALRNVAYKSLEPMLSKIYVASSPPSPARGGGAARGGRNNANSEVKFLLQQLCNRVKDSLPHAEQALSASFTHSKTTLLEAVRTVCMASLLLGAQIDLSELREAVSLIEVKMMKPRPQAAATSSSSSPKEEEGSESKEIKKGGGGGGGIVEDDHDRLVLERVFRLEARCFLHHRATNFPQRSTEWRLAGVHESVLSHPHAIFGTARSLWELSQEEEESDTRWLVIREPSQLSNPALLGKPPTEASVGGGGGGGINHENEDDQQGGVKKTTTVVLPWSLFVEAHQPLRLYDEDKSSQASFDGLWAQVKKLLDVHPRVRFLAFEEELSLLSDIKASEEARKKPN